VACSKSPKEEAAKGAGGDVASINKSLVEIEKVVPESNGKQPDLVWQDNIKNFIQMVKIIEGFDYYASENSNLFTAFDNEVKRLGNDVKNADKDGYFFLRTAHKNVMNKRQAQ
jgi:hypothetical protein